MLETVLVGERRSGTLVEEVRRLGKGHTHELVPANVGIEHTRAKVEPMVRGFFARAEQDVVLATLEKSIVYVTSVLGGPRDGSIRVPHSLAWCASCHSEIRNLPTVLDDGSAICPAGLAMTKPRLMSDGRTQWSGVGCAKCRIRPQCTTRSRRSLTADLNLEKVRNEMRLRMAEPGATERYGQRIATVEPAFSNIEDSMSFRRASSRHPATIFAEVLLKVVAHNLSRISAARRLACVHVPLELD